MKPETLETLLVDHALGELSPEAAELLAAWCAQHPADAATAATVASTLQLAREATAAMAPPAAESVPVPTWQGPAWRRRRPELLRLAACLALGASLGWLMRPLPHAPAAPAVAVLPSVFEPAVEPATPPSRFWSISARVEAARRGAQPAERPKSAHSFTLPALLKMPQPEPQS